MKLTLLGTGVPIPDARRRGASQTVEIGNELLLIDCGAGALHRFVEAGYTMPGGRQLRLPLRRIALTHLHSDHITGLADLLWAGWTMGWWTVPPVLSGPPGTASMIDHLMKAFSYDIRVRSYADLADSPGPAPVVEEIDEGYAVQENGWKLTAFRVDHAPVDQAFGFRVDSDEGSVVVSGDTCYCDNLIRHAHEADLLVHEVYWRTGLEGRVGAASTPAQRRRAETIVRYHTPAEDTGRIASAAAVGQLVLSHVILAGGSPDDIRQDAAQHYAGSITVGEDLQTFEVRPRAQGAPRA